VTERLTRKWRGFRFGGCDRASGEELSANC
jgi:hypothetical protein